MKPPIYASHELPVHLNGRNNAIEADIGRILGWVPDSIRWTKEHR